MRWLRSLLLALAFAAGAAGVARAQAPPIPCTAPIIPKIISGTTYTLGADDYCWTVIFTNPGAITVYLPAPGNIFYPGFTTTLLPLGGGTITMTGLQDDSGHIHKVNLVTTLTLLPGAGAILRVQEDYNWYALSVAAGGSVISLSQAPGITLTPNPITSIGTIGCSLFSSGALGCVPASGGGTANFLRADGTWAPAGAPGGTNGNVQFNNAGAFGGVGGSSCTAAGSCTWPATQTYAAVAIGGRTVSGTTDTLSAADCGTVVQYTASTNVTVTLPNDIAAGPPYCHVTQVQEGTGLVIDSPAAGATLVNGHGFTKTYTQHAGISVMVTANVGGAAAEWTLFGDGQ